VQGMSEKQEMMKYRSVFNEWSAVVAEHGVKLSKIVISDFGTEFMLFHEGVYGSALLSSGMTSSIEDDEAADELIDYEIKSVAKVMKCTAAAGPDAFHMAVGNRCATCRQPMRAIDLNERSFVCHDSKPTCEWPRRAFIATEDGPKFVDDKGAGES